MSGSKRKGYELVEGIHEVSNVADRDDNLFACTGCPNSQDWLINKTVNCPGREAGQFYKTNFEFSCPAPPRDLIAATVTDRARTSSKSQEAACLE